MKKLKEKRCFLSPAAIQEEKYMEERKIKDSYMLPDNSTLELTFEKQRAPEILMQPEKYGLEIMCMLRNLQYTSDSGAAGEYD